MHCFLLEIMLRVGSSPVPGETGPGCVRASLSAHSWNGDPAHRIVVARPPAVRFIGEPATCHASVRKIIGHGDMWLRVLARGGTRWQVFLCSAPLACFRGFNLWARYQSIIHHRSGDGPCRRLLACVNWSLSCAASRGGTESMGNGQRHEKRAQDRFRFGGFRFGTEIRTTHFACTY